MLDQLRAQVKREQGTAETPDLPREWQFLTVDVPLKAESGPHGLPNVEESGGTYVPVGSNQTYSSFDQGLSQTLGAPDKKVLGEIASWASRNPGTEQTPIDKAAGQFRGIGRMLTIQHLGRIREALEQALDRLNSIPGDESSPQVFVVSSMAGGAGASMFLDVCRLLTTLKGIQTGDIAAFMYTPEVFETLPPDSRVGMWPNALAMFGEAVAAQFGAGTESDARLFQAMGVTGDVSAASIGRLIPIGARLGANGATFGDGTPEAIYRGLGKALAALMTSRPALEDFTRYTMGNRGGKDPDRSVHGWGDPNDPKADDIPWGSMGYAQLSLGRDRYAEYSAQRLARAAFERLLSGHVDPALPQTGAEQLETRVQDNFRYFLLDVDLPLSLAAPQEDQQESYEWLLNSFGPQANQAVLLMQQELQNHLPDGQGRTAQEFGQLIQGRLQDPELARRLQSIIDSLGVYHGPGQGRLVYAAVHAFADRLANSLTDQVEEQLARYGLAYARALLERLQEGISTRLIPFLRDTAAQVAQVDLMTQPPNVADHLRQFTGRGTVSNPQVTIEDIVNSYADQFGHYFLWVVAGQLAPVLEDFLRSALVPLKKSLAEVHHDLEVAEVSAPREQKLSDTSTDEPAAWPRGPVVPGRFRGSENEIVISQVEDFPVHYEDQLMHTQRSLDPEIRELADATRSAAREIIRGRWETQGGRAAPADALAPQLPEDLRAGNRMGWVGRDLVSDPYDPAGERRTARTATFQPKLSPADLLDRARQWIARPHLPFHDFIRVDLRTYLDRNHAESLAGYTDRLRRLREAFAKAVANARPLAAVDSQMIGRAYYGSSRADYRLAFSELPFAGLPDVERELEAVLIADKNLDQNTTLESFHSTKTKTSSDQVDTIEVFGSYPNYSPIVFSSLLPHIARDWAARPGEKAGFWDLRRARPLPAALPLTNAEREAMIAGWLIGVLTGRIFIENSGSADAVAFIYDDAAAEWINFPRQLLTPPTKFRASYDWMPAVIESVLLAYADSHSTAEGEMTSSLRPYRVLRGLYDSGRTGPTTGNVRHPAVDRLADWLRTGQQPPVGAARPAPDTLEQRYDFAVHFFTAHQQTAAEFVPATGQHFVPGRSDAHKPRAEVEDRQTAAELPTYRDLAPDILRILPILMDKLQDARRQAETPLHPAGLPYEEFPGLGGVAGGDLL